MNRHAGKERRGECQHRRVPAAATNDAARQGLEPARCGLEPGAPRVLAIPISFVTDHVETLAEINIEARQLAQQLGIGQFELMPALNDSPAFIRALADLVLAQLATPTSAAAGGHNPPLSQQ